MKVIVNILTTLTVQPERSVQLTRAALILVFVAVIVPSISVNCQTIAPLSRGWYRLPYVDGTQMQGPGNNLFQGHNGHDVFGFPLKAWDDPSPYKIAAAADGVVFRVTDSNNECGINVDSSTCNNNIWVDHLNGDITVYDHIAFQSAQVDSGDFVVEGQWIANEGDVGFTLSSDSVLNRPKLGCDLMQDTTGDPFPYCGVHLHLSVTDSDTVLVHPRICGIPSHVLLSTTAVSSCVPCNSGDACVTDTTVSESWTGKLNVIVVDNELLTKGSVVVENSVIGFQAGNRITLKPGFRAVTGSYFRAEIGPCER